MRHCFDNAAVEAESRLDKFFAVTCRAGAYDFQFSASQCSFLLQGVQSIRYSLDRISQIQAVISKDNISRRRPHKVSRRRPHKVFRRRPRGFAIRGKQALISLVIIRIHPYRNDFSRSRPRVNTNHNLLFSFVQRFGFRSEFRLRFEPILMFFLIFEERQQTAGPFRLYFFLHPASENRNRGC